MLLYELLSDALPFDDETLRSADLLKIQRLIGEVVPPRPSRRLQQSSEAAAGRGQHAARRELSARRSAVRGDLDWIVMRCLEKDRERRYGTVGELLADLERHASGAPVLAGPPTVGYRLAKFVRRHRLALLSAATIAALLIGGTVVSWRQAVRARRAEAHMRLEAERANLELAKYEGISEFLQDVLLGIDPEVAQGEDRALLRMILERATERVARDTGEAPEVEAICRLTIGRAWYSIAYCDDALPKLERALELFRELYGPDDHRALEALSDLGGVLMIMGRMEQARPLIEESLERHRQHMGRDHPGTLSVLSKTRPSSATSTWLRSSPSCSESNTRSRWPRSTTWPGPTRTPVATSRRCRCSSTPCASSPRCTTPTIRAS